MVPPCGDGADLQGSWLGMRLPLARLLDELAEDLVLKLRMSQTDLQGALSQRDMVVDSWGINGHVDEELTRLRAEHKR